MLCLQLWQGRWQGDEIIVKVLQVRDWTTRKSRDFNEEHPKLRLVKAGISGSIQGASLRLSHGVNLLICINWSWWHLVLLFLTLHICVNMLMWGWVWLIGGWMRLLFKQDFWCCAVSRGFLFIVRSRRNRGWVGAAVKYLLAFLPVSCVRLYSVKKKTSHKHPSVCKHKVRYGMKLS